MTARLIGLGLGLAVTAGYSAVQGAERPKEPQRFAAARDRMVDEEIVAAGVRDARVIGAMRATPRHEFVPAAHRARAYFDMALPIGYRQTISPPFVVAYMTEQIDPRPSDKVLEVGTGSGYQAAVLSPLVDEVYSIEILEPLGQRAAQTLRRLQYDNVHVKVGDGYQGWEEHAPFDKIIVTCSPEDVPERLVAQLAEGGRMIIPVGERYQQTLYRFEKLDGKLRKTALLPTLFVPMTGQAEDERDLLPDPTRPAIVNGDFESLTEQSTKPGTKSSAKPSAKPRGWHYQRQLKLARHEGKKPDQGQDKPADGGRYFIQFSNTDPGRGSQALQGMAIDGRAVRFVDVALMVRGAGVRRGQARGELPTLSITFYDQDRARTGHYWLGPWQGTFDWKEVRRVIAVPQATREAIVRIGLNGATGELGMDNVRLSTAERP